MQFLTTQWVGERLLGTLHVLLSSEFPDIDQRQLGIACGLDRARWWNGPHRDNMLVMARLTEQLTEHAVPDIALRVADRAQLTDLGMMGYAMLTSATLEQAIRIACFSLQEANYAVQAELGEDDGHAAIHFKTMEHRRGPEQLLLDIGMISAWRYLQALLPKGREVLPSYVCLDREPPRHHQRYRQVMGCDVHFNAGRNLLALPKPWLREAIPTGNSQLLFACGAHMHHALRQSQHDENIIERVKQLLLERQQDCGFSLPRTAQVMGLNPHSLRRHLASAGGSFRRIALEARMELALAYLRSTPMSPKQIAYQLGYSEPNNFIRAFKGYYGVPPQAMREAGEPDSR